MQHREELLRWLNPDLDKTVAEGAGSLLDAVAAYLRDSGPTKLFDTAPPVTFDPVTASAYVPPPAELPGDDDPVSSRAPGTPVPEPTDLEWLAPDELAALIRSGQVSRAEVLQRSVGRIEEWNPVLNAFIRVTLGPGSLPPRPVTGRGLLDGVPIGVQDLIATAGIATTAGSRILRDYVPGADASVWRLLADEGAVLAGKLNTHEFAAGTTGENRWFGAVRNPWDPSRSAGGAAGGPGAAVAAGLVPAALATDPGGSIRVPAAHCGIVGLKPTYGAVDRAGVIPLTWTTETIGVLARTVGAAAGLADLLLDGRAVRRYGVTCELAARRGARAGRLDLRVGVPSGWLAMGLDPEVDRAYKQSLDELAALGATLVEAELPDAADIAPTHRAIAFAEASAIHEELLLNHAADYGDNIRERQEAGRGVLASEYLKAFRLRGLFARQFSEAWRAADVIALPTSPVPAAPHDTPVIDTGPRGPEPTHTVYTRYSAPMSTLGLPAVSVPCGFTADGLPVGLQLSGPPHSEPLLFHVSAAYESVTPWHLWHPRLVADVPQEQA